MQPKKKVSNIGGVPFQDIRHLQGMEILVESSKNSSTTSMKYKQNLNGVTISLQYSAPTNRSKIATNPTDKTNTVTHETITYKLQNLSTSRWMPSNKSVELQAKIEPTETI